MSEEALLSEALLAKDWLTPEEDEAGSTLWRAGGAKKAHPFEALSGERGISHRFTAPRIPRTDGMVERLNRLVKEGAVGNRRHDALKEVALDRCRTCNPYRPHGGIDRRTPLQEASRWYKERSALFTREPPRKSVQAFPTDPD